MEISEMYTSEVDKILVSDTVRSLVDEVEKLYKVKEVVLDLDENLSEHGAFIWEASSPIILVNPKTGLNVSNIAHELIHAIQYKYGFPFIKGNVYKDKREKVIVELNSNILHIHLVSEFNKRNISVEEYLSPTIEDIIKVLKKRNKKQVKKLPVLRIHYEASVYLRIIYEAMHLKQQEKKYVNDLFRQKTPVGYQLANEFRNIIEKYDVLEPKGSTFALLSCIEHLNGNNASSIRADFSRDLYEVSVNEIKEKYSDYLDSI